MIPEADILQDNQSISADLQNYLLEYVNANCYNSALCLNSVADHLHISIYAVSRAFKDLTGVGFKDYVTARRLQYACRLLEETDKPVTEVACLSGFENATYFTTVFKSEFGIPPSKYRQPTKDQE